MINFENIVNKINNHVHHELTQVKASYRAFYDLFVIQRNNGKINKMKLNKITESSDSNNNIFGELNRDL